MNKSFPTSFRLPLLVLLLCCQYTSAAILADYQFASNGDYSSSDGEPNSLASDLVVGAGAPVSSFSGAGNPALSLYWTTGWLDATATVGTNRYLSVTVTPELGYQIDFTGFTFEMAIQDTETDAPRQYGLFSSVDGFTTVIATGFLTTDPTDDVFNSYSISLAGSAFQDVTTGTEFRLVLFDRSTLGGPSDREFRIDNVTVNGSAAIAPPPPVLLADYQFTNNGDYFSSDTEPNTVASDLVVGPGAPAPAFSGLGNPLRSLYWSTGWFDTAATLANNRYLSVTITPDMGVEVDFISLDFEMAIQDIETDAPQQYGLFSSADGYVNVIATGSLTKNSTNDVFNAYSISLTASEFQNVTAATVFRLVFFDRPGVGTARQMRVDNVTVTGSVASSLVLYDDDFETLVDEDGAFLDGLNGWSGYRPASDTPKIDVTGAAYGVCAVGAPLGGFVQKDIGNLGLTSTSKLQLDMYVSLTNDVASSGVYNVAMGVGPGIPVGIDSAPLHMGAQYSGFYFRQDDFGSSVTAVDGTGTAIQLNGGQIYHLRGIWDFATGTGSYQQRNVTLGETAFTQLYFDPAQTVSDVNLGIYPDVTTWDNVWVRTGTGTGARLLRLTLTDISSLTPLEIWASGYGIATVDPSSDDDKDGLELLLEYALDSNPTVAQIPGNIPALGATDGTSYTFPRYPDRTDITYTVEVSTNLSGWTEAAQSVNGGATTPLSGDFSISTSGSDPVETTVTHLNPTNPIFWQLSVD